MTDQTKTALLSKLRAEGLQAGESVAEPIPETCQGKNCGARSGEKHSPECILEAAQAQGWTDSPEAEAARAALSAQPSGNPGELAAQPGALKQGGSE